MTDTLMRILQEVFGPVQEIGEDTRDIAPFALASPGTPKILSAGWWKETTPQERGLLGKNHGIYSIPTTELVDHLAKIIRGRTAIEIGAGNGALAAALDIPATDSRMQDNGQIASHYQKMGQVPVTYGPNVIEMDAHQAVREYQPDVVIACWVTHRFSNAYPDRGGNWYGVDEEDILANCNQYVFVGNLDVHKEKPLWGRRHEINFPAWVYSRASNPDHDFIARWRRKR